MNSIYKFLFILDDPPNLALVDLEPVRACQVPVGVVRVLLHVEGDLVCVLGPPGAAEVAPVVVAGVSVLPDAEVAEAEGEEVAGGEVLDCVVLVLDLEVLGLVGQREDEGTVVVVVLGGLFRWG